MRKYRAPAQPRFRISDFECSDRPSFDSVGGESMLWLHRASSIEHRVLSIKSLLWLPGSEMGVGDAQGSYSNISCVYQKISGFWRLILLTLRKVIEETLMFFFSSGQ